MNPHSVKTLDIHITGGCRVSALWSLPETARAVLILAHGAGAGMHHPFMESLAVELAARGVGTLRYQFPYMERGSKRPDPPALCHATVRSAVIAAHNEAPGLPLFAGGKSFGGRMTSQAQSQAPLQDVRGLVFIGFPLHPSGRPGSERARHLEKVQIPMLFLQGTRDELATLELLEPVVQGLAERATLQIVDDADHSFHVRARSGRKDAQVIGELAEAITRWVAAR